VFAILKPHGAFNVNANQKSNTRPAIYRTLEFAYFKTDEIIFFII